MRKFLVLLYWNDVYKMHMSLEGNSNRIMTRMSKNGSMSVFIFVIRVVVDKRLEAYGVAP